jgi:hypothetical protein
MCNVNVHIIIIYQGQEKGSLGEACEDRGIPSQTLERLSRFIGASVTEGTLKNIRERVGRVEESFVYFTTAPSHQ